MLSPESLYMFYTGIVCSTCSTTAAMFNLPVVAMCTGSVGNGSLLVIDTFDSLSYGTDECVCTGTVKSSVSTSTQLHIHTLPTIQSEPESSGCGSSIVLQSGSTTITSSCALTGSIAVTDSDPVTVKWKLDRTVNVLSKYCILLYLRNTNDLPLIMTCTSATEQSTTTHPTTTTTATTTDRTTTAISTEIINTQELTTTLFEGSATLGSNGVPENTNNSTVTVLVVTVSVLVVLLVSALVFVIYRRKSNRDATGIAEQTTCGKSGVPQVIYENTNTQNDTRKYTKEQSEPSSGRPQSAGSQYTQLHVYSNETNDEYSKPGSTKESVYEIFHTVVQC